jgi:2-polyprenyl-6-methoxyphenol hydroxylase-like FAD-dependent oxidoreductase
MVGLGAALALAKHGRKITLVERDPALPEIPLDRVFRDWERRGVAQLRHSHIFLGRLMMLLREQFPSLLEELEAAGARRFTFNEALPPPLRGRYRPEPGDEDLALLYCRRTTFEFVMRRHVERLPGVHMLTGTTMRGLISAREKDGLVVQGVRCERDGAAVDLRADIVIDASGRSSLFPKWLKAENVTIGEEESPAGILYFTRHYRLKSGADEPAFDGSPMAGDLGYIKFGICPADNGHFSITLAVPEIERDLRHAITEPARFDAVCAALPGCARWTERSEPVSSVFAMGNLKSVWRSSIKDGKPQVLNFFALGDAAIRTNPLYGRGCSAGIVHAFGLSEVLETIADAGERALMMERRVHDGFRPFYESMARQDLQSIRRAESEQAQSGKLGLKGRLRQSLVEEGVVPAMLGDLDIVRAAARAFHMIDPPISWRKRPRLFAKVLWMWAKPRRLKRSAHLYPSPLGPKRGDLLAMIGLT